MMQPQRWRRFFRRPLLLICIVATTLGVVIIFYSRRLELQVDIACILLNHCRSAERASERLDRLVAGPSGATKLRLAMRKVSGDRQWMSFWLLTWKAAADEYGVLGHSPDDILWAEMLSNEIDQRPELARAHAQAMRYVRRTSGATTYGARSYLEILDSAIELGLIEPHGEGDIGASAMRVLRFQGLFGLFGRDDLVVGLNERNLSKRYQEWGRWYLQNREQLMYDPLRGSFHVAGPDKQIMRSQRTFPEHEPPFPVWKGDLPVCKKRKHMGQPASLGGVVVQRL